ncbi:hypothetical protein ACOME3_007044 [Neoechinorhynchus agilis]
MTFCRSFSVIYSSANENTIDVITDEGLPTELQKSLSLHTGSFAVFATSLSLYPEFERHTYFEHDLIEHMKTILNLRVPIALVASEGNTLFFLRDWLGLRSLVMESINKEGEIVVHLSSTDRFGNGDEVEYGKVWSFDLKTRQTKCLYADKYVVSSIEKLTDQCLIPRFVQILRRTVKARLKQKTLPILFSGGVDSLLLVKICLQELESVKRICLINVSFDGEHAPDRISAKEILGTLMDKRIFITHWIEGSIEDQNELIPIAQSCKPNNSVLDWSLARVLWVALWKYSQSKCWSSNAVVVSGLGADEIFAGYARHSRETTASLRKCLMSDLGKVGKRNGGRDDRVALLSTKGGELFCPFLEKEVVDFAMNEVKDDFKLKTENGKVVNKFILRQTLKE